MMVPKDGMAARQARGLEGGGRMDESGGMARRAGRALVLLGAVLLLLENVLSWVGYVIPVRAGRF